MDKKFQNLVIAPDGAKHYRTSRYRYKVACMVQCTNGFWEVYCYSVSLKNIQKHLNGAKRKRIYKHCFDKEGNFLFDEDMGPLYLQVILAHVQIEE
jgi:hypothetical protein